jgi:tRNA(Ile2) C34 agmatinyltransferase TiaS
MEIGAILLIFALALGVALIISQPFLDARMADREAVSHSPEELAERKRSGLMAERERLINAVTELDHDHALGKIADEDYPAARAELLLAGAEIFKQLDQLAVKAEPCDEIIQTSIDDQTAGMDDEIEKLIAERARAKKEKSAGFCPKCGKCLQASDKFCSRCGTPIL